MKITRNGSILLYMVLSLTLLSAIGMYLNALILPNMTVGLDSVKIHQADYAVDAFRNILRDKTKKYGFWETLHALKDKPVTLGNNVNVTATDIEVSWIRAKDEDNFYTEDETGIKTIGKDKLSNNSKVYVIGKNGSSRVCIYKKNTNGNGNTTGNNSDDIPVCTFEEDDDVLFMPDKFTITSTSVKINGNIEVPEQYGLLSLADGNEGTHRIVYDNYKNLTKLDDITESPAKSASFTEENSQLIIDRHADIKLAVTIGDTQITRTLSVNHASSLSGMYEVNGSLLIFDFFKEIMNHKEESPADTDAKFKTLDNLLDNRNIDSGAYGKNTDMDTNKSYGTSGSAAKLLMDTLLAGNYTASQTVFNNKYTWRIEAKKNGTSRYFDIFLADQDINETKDAFDTGSHYIRVWRLRYYPDLNDTYFNDANRPDGYVCIVEPLWVHISKNSISAAGESYYTLNTDANGKAMSPYTRRNETTKLGFVQSEDGSSLLIQNSDTLHNLSKPMSAEAYYTHEKCNDEECYPYSDDNVNNIIYAFDWLGVKLISQNPASGNLSEILKDKTYYANILFRAWKGDKKNQKQLRFYLVDSACKIPSAGAYKTRYVQGTWYVQSFDKKGNPSKIALEPASNTLKPITNNLYRFLLNGTALPASPNGWVCVEYDLDNGTSADNRGTETLDVSDEVSDCNAQWKTILGY